MNKKPNTITRLPYRRRLSQNSVRETNKEEIIDKVNELVEAHNEIQSDPTN